MMPHFLSCLTILFAFILQQQAQNLPSPLLSEGSIDSLEITGTEQYQGKGLYGYIDGGAEIYLEYGFSNLTVQDLKTGAREYKVETYRMKNPAAAFGIFSVSTLNCPRNPEITDFACMNSYQVLFAKGPYFISITNFDGDSSSQGICVEIAKKLNSKIPDEKIHFPAFVENFSDSLKRNLRFISGTLGLQNGFPEWISLFDGINNFKLWVLPVEEEHTRTVFSWVQFEDAAAEDSVLKKTGLISQTKNYNGWLLNENKKTSFAAKVVDGKTLDMIRSSADIRSEIEKVR